MNIEITINGIPPSKSNQYQVVRFGKKASLAKTKKLKAYEESFLIQCMERYPEIVDMAYEGEFSCHVDAYFGSRRPDLDNVFKALLDCLQKKTKTIKNDNKCMYIEGRKLLDKENPRVVIKLKSIEQ